MNSETPLLEVEGLRKSFAGVHAVDNMSFSVAHNTITGIIGPNGSGKSTTIDCISGFQRPNAGRVKLDGRDITRLTPQKIAKSGLIRTFQTVHIYEAMTLRENLLQAARPFQEAGWVADFSPRSERILDGRSRTISLTSSAMIDLPYIFFRCETGTLPGRKPLMRTLSLASARRSFI